MDTQRSARREWNDACHPHHVTARGIRLCCPQTYQFDGAVPPRGFCAWPGCWACSREVCVDQKQFDQLTVAIARATHRRALLHLAGGSLAVLLAGLGLGDDATDAAKRGTHHRKRRRKTHDQQRAGSDAKSCAQQCRKKQSKSARRKCRKRCQPPIPACTTSQDCPAGELCESGICIPIPDQCTVDTDCDACERCEAGVCVARCQPDQVCRNDQCAAVECTADGDCRACSRCLENRCRWQCTVTERCLGGSGNWTCCQPRGCPAGAECGTVDDGCGGQARCGPDTCPAPETCGGGDPGTPNVCGCTPVDPCGPTSCGDLTNNCGEVIDCGGCPTGQTCGGGGAPNVCGCTLCPVNETCSGGGCDCKGFGEVAPFTCCPSSGVILGRCASANNSSGTMTVADTCEFVSGGCPPGYTTCLGSACQACCPPGTTCDPAGFCRQSTCCSAAATSRSSRSTQRRGGRRHRARQIVETTEDGVISLQLAP
jgi:hypothetical protein